MKPPYPKPPPTKPTTTNAPVATLISKLLVLPLLVVLFWNYGGTEVIQALGGPDANVNIVDGFFAVYCLAAVSGYFRGTM